MTIEKIKVIIPFLFLSLGAGVIEDKDVVSVLPRKPLQKHANFQGVCSVYPDGNYYLYEGEACILFPLGKPTKKNTNQWQWSQASYNTDILSVYESKPFLFDSNTTLGPYYPASYVQGLIIMGLKEGNDIVKVTLHNPSHAFTYKVVVLNNNDTRLRNIDNQGLFQVIAQQNISQLVSLMQEGTSLNQSNEKHESALQLIAQTNNIAFIEQAAALITDSALLDQLLKATITFSVPGAASVVMQYIPFASLEAKDKSEQEYCAIHGVAGALYLKKKKVALALLKQGYPISGKAGDKIGLNAFFLAFQMQDLKLVSKCIDRMNSDDLSVANKYTLQLGGVKQEYSQGVAPLQLLLDVMFLKDEKKNQVEWKDDAERTTYYHLVEKILKKIDPKQLLLSPLQAPALLKYLINSKDTRLTQLLKKYTTHVLSLTPQQILKHLHAIAPKGPWSDSLRQQAYFLIEGIKNIGVQDTQGNTALMLALQQNKIPIAKLLLHKMFFPALVIVNKENKSALEIAQEHNHPDIVKLITTHLTTEKSHYFYEGFSETCSSAMYIPAIDKKKGVVATTGCLKAQGGQRSGAQEINILPAQYVYNGAGTLTVLSQKNSGVLYTAHAIADVMGVKDLKEAAKKGYENKLPYLTTTAFMQLTDKEREEIDPQNVIKSYVQSTGFFAALEYGDEALAQAFLNARYPVPTGLNNNKQSSVMAAFAHKATTIGKMLFAKLPSSEYGQQDDHGKTLIMYTIIAGDKETTTTLLNKMSIQDLEKVDKEGNTALMWAVQHNMESVALALIQKMNLSSLLQKNTQGKNALDLCKGLPQVQAMLGPILKGNINWQTLLSGSIGQINKTLAGPYVRLNVQDQYGNTALMWAIQQNNTPLAQKLIALSTTDLNLQDHYGNTALMWAIQTNNTPLAQTLINKKEVNLNIQDKRGNTALMWAIQESNTQIAQTLINKPGVNLNLQDHYGNTALMWAIQESNTHLAQLLIKKPGVNLSLKDVHGNTALMWAQQENLQPLIQLLSKH